MGVDKFRRKIIFKDGFTAAGSAGFNGAIQVNTKITLGGGATISGLLTVNSGLYFGATTIASGITTSSVANTAVKSNDWFALTPLMSGGAQNSLGQLCVRTIAEGASFTIGWSNGGFYGGGPTTVFWEIRRIG